MKIMNINQKIRKVVQKDKNLIQLIRKVEPENLTIWASKLGKLSLKKRLPEAKSLLLTMLIATILLIMMRVWMFVERQERLWQRKPWHSPQHPWPLLTFVITIANHYHFLEYKSWSRIVIIVLYTMFCFLFSVLWALIPFVWPHISYHILMPGITKCCQYDQYRHHCQHCSTFLMENHLKHTGRILDRTYIRYSDVQCQYSVLSTVSVNAVSSS